MGGLWEFPGGKVRGHEDPAAGLRRELDEELGIRARVGSPITFAVHSEPGLRIVLLFFATEIASGTPHPREGQEVAWVAIDDLDRYPTPPADAELVRLLTDSSRPAPASPA
jgi:8-oxo-dGTP diphosphatase